MSELDLKRAFRGNTGHRMNESHVLVGQGDPCMDRPQTKSWSGSGPCFASSLKVDEILSSQLLNKVKVKHSQRSMSKSSTSTFKGVTNGSPTLPRDLHWTPL